MSAIPLFKYVDLETCSSCNRVCPTCLRNSHPNREALQSWFEPEFLPVRTIKDALNQCMELGFLGSICLSHYNEPLMDERISEIGRMAKSYGQFSKVYMHSNGDLLNEDIANDLDGAFDQIIFTLYMNEPVKSKRANWIKSLFHKTKVEIITYSEHIATHFSPKFDVKSMAEKYREHPCSNEPQIHLIINHRRQYLLCCEDVIGNFDLGYFPDISIEDYWFGKKHVGIIADLGAEGGRLKHEYCATCPRP